VKPMNVIEAKSSPIAIGGPLIVWLDALTPAELDRIEAYGDGLAPMRAELAGRSDIPGHKRITRAAQDIAQPATDRPVAL
jgi:hypothetical protein